MPRRHDLELFLKQAELFNKLKAKERERIADFSRRRSYARGETIFYEGQPSDSVWLLLEGRVHLLHHAASGRVQTTCVITPGETFCCLPALDQGLYPATALATTRTQVLQIPSQLFQELMQRSAAMRQEVICFFCSRMRQVEAKGCSAYDPVEQRIAQALLTLQKKFAETIPLTKQEVAELVGTSVETAIRTISRFQQQGWVRSSRGRIGLLDPRALRRLLSGSFSAPREGSG